MNRKEILNKLNELETEYQEYTEVNKGSLLAINQLKDWLTLKKEETYSFTIKEVKKMALEAIEFLYSEYRKKNNRDIGKIVIYERFLLEM